MSFLHNQKTGTVIDNFQFTANKVLFDIFAMFIIFPVFLENLAEGVSSSASAQRLWLLCVAVLCTPLVDTTGTASHVLLVGSVQQAYCVAAVWVMFKPVFVFQDW